MWDGIIINELALLTRFATEEFNFKIEISVCKCWVLSAFGKTSVEHGAILSFSCSQLLGH